MIRVYGSLHKMHYWKLNQILTQVSPISPTILVNYGQSFCLDQNIWPNPGINKIVFPMGKKRR